VTGAALEFTEPLPPELAEVLDRLRTPAPTPDV